MSLIREYTCQAELKKRKLFVRYYPKNLDTFGQTAVLHSCNGNPWSRVWCRWYFRARWTKHAPLGPEQNHISLIYSHLITRSGPGESKNNPPGPIGRSRTHQFRPFPVAPATTHTKNRAPQRLCFLYQNGRQWFPHLGNAQASLAFRSARHHFPIQ